MVITLVRNNIVQQLKRKVWWSRYDWKCKI